MASLYVHFLSWTRFESINASSEAKRAAVKKFASFLLSDFKKNDFPFSLLKNDPLSEITFLNYVIRYDRSLHAGGS